MDGIDLEHTHIEPHRFVDDIHRAVDRGTGGVELRQWNKAFDVVADVDDHALVHQPDDGAGQLRTDRVRLADAKPWILLGLLEPKADALVLAVDIEDDHVHGVALFHDFRRMLHALGPAHVGNMNEPIDARLDLDERTEAREIAHFSVDSRADGVLEREHHPGILLRLLHAEGNLFFVRIDLEDDRFDGFPNGHELARMPDIARPTHFADVNEALDAWFELDERTVVRDRDHLSGDAGSDRILVGDVLPRIALQLLQPKADALAGPINVEHFDLELRPDLDHF